MHSAEELSERRGKPLRSVISGQPSTYRRRMAIGRHGGSGQWPVSCA